LLTIYALEIFNSNIYIEKMTFILNSEHACPDARMHAPSTQTGLRRTDNINIIVDLAHCGGVRFHNYST